MNRPPQLSMADIDRWDPTALNAVAGACAARADAAVEMIAAVRVYTHIISGWSGNAADAATAHLERIVAALAAKAEAARIVALAATVAAERITDCKVLYATSVDAIVAEAGSVDAELTASLLSVRAPLTQSPAEPDAPSTEVPSAQSSPDDIRDWWNALHRAEREALISQCPERIGNLDGVPIEARDRANRSLLCRDLEDTAGMILINAQEVRDGLTINSDRTGSPTYLVTYQPDRFDGQGRAAIAIGNPDTATHTTVLVPGTGASVTSGWLSDDTDQSNLFNELCSAATGPVAVVAWMGYNTPDSLADPRVALTRLARDGGRLLATDVGALRATARPDAHLTVVGHSYGATTVSDAAALSSMRADDVVLIGSPGSDLAHTAADFHLPAGGHVYVGAASTDPVTFLAGTRGEIPGTGIPTGLMGLGADPAADGFGSTRFRAEAPGFGAAVWTDHGSYLTPGSESLYSIADIAVGDGELLAEHGMTAPHRTSALGRLASALALPNWGSPLSDPELLRPATDGHVHRRARG